MEDFEIDEISGVDRPAQPAARVTLMKRYSKVAIGDMVSWNSSGGRAQGKVERIVRDGSIDVPDSSFTINGTDEDPAVLIQLYRDGKPTETRVGHRQSTLTQASKGEGQQEDESSENRNTSLEQTAENGHTPVAEVNVTAGTEGRNEEISMTNKNDSAGEQAVTKEQLEAVQAELQLAKAYGALTDAEKAYAADLSEGDERTAFIHKSATERKSILEKATAADPVVYTCDDGTELRKSAGDLAVRLAKQSDEMRRQLDIEKAARRNDELAKAARETIPALPGDDLAKVELIRAVQSITDSGLRKSVETILSAANEQAKMALATRGVVGKASGGYSGGDSMDPGEELEMRARKRAAEQKMPFARAFKEEIMTDEGRELMRRSRQG